MNVTRRFLFSEGKGEGGGKRRRVVHCPFDTGGKGEKC